MKPMRIFLIGGTGFIGRAIAERLLADGYTLRLCVRDPAMQPALAGVEYVKGDFNIQITDEANESAWRDRLAGCDAVINAVGIIRESRDATFERLHYEGPLALFRAARSLKIRRLMQISALGADEHAETKYHLSKRKADEALRKLIPSAVILRPSLVIGHGGKSTKLLALLATLPLLPLPGGGRFLLQPLRIEDLAAGVSSLIAKWPSRGVTVDVAGPEVVTMAQMLQSFRRNAGFAAAYLIGIPMSWMRTVARWGTGIVNEETLQMLERGNTGDALPFERLTGLTMRSPLALPAGTLYEAALSVIRPMLRYSIAFVWIWTAIVTAFLYEPGTSMSWLKQSGVPDGLLVLFLYGSCLFDLVLGLMLFTRFRRLSYGCQLAAVAFYTLVIMFRIPELLLHPLGPISKNIPLLVLTAVGWLFDGDDSSGRRRAERKRERER